MRTVTTKTVITMMDVTQLARLNMPMNVMMLVLVFVTLSVETKREQMLKIATTEILIVGMAALNFVNLKLDILATEKNLTFVKLLSAEMEYSLSVMKIVMMAIQTLKMDATQTASLKQAILVLRNLFLNAHMSAETELELYLKTVITGF